MTDFFEAYETRRVELCHEHTAKMQALRDQEADLRNRAREARGRSLRFGDQGQVNESIKAGQEGNALIARADHIARHELPAEQARHAQIASGIHPELGALRMEGERAREQARVDRATKLCNDRVKARAAWDAALAKYASRNHELRALAQAVMDAERAAQCFLDPTISTLLAPVDSPLEAA